MSEETNQTITFEGVSHLLADLTEEGRNIVSALRVCEEKISDHQSQAGLLSEAHTSLVEKLRAELPVKEDTPAAVDPEVLAS